MDNKTNKGTGWLWKTGNLIKGLMKKIIFIVKMGLVYFLLYGVYLIGVPDKNICAGMDSIKLFILAFIITVYLENRSTIEEVLAELLYKVIK